MSKPVHEILGIEEGVEANAENIQAAINRASGATASRYTKKLEELAAKNSANHGAEPKNYESEELLRIKQELNGYREKDFKTKIETRIKELAPNSNSEKVFKYANLNSNMSDDHINSVIKDVGQDFLNTESSGGKIPKTFGSSRNDNSPTKKTGQEIMMQNLKINSGFGNLNK